MIKIVKWGNYVICPNCNCEFTYEPEDVEYGRQQWDDDYKIVRCPCCKHQIDLKER